MTEKNIAPSLICTDLLNLEKEVKNLEQIGCRMLHIDIIDGIFSPDMPIGIETVKRLRKITDMTFDAHLMSTNNSAYTELLLGTDVDRLCFHTEFEKRPAILLRKIKAAGIKAGIAISPETTIESIRYLLPLCDFVLLMRIDAGYAHLAGQAVYPQTEEKIATLKKYMDEYGISFEIEVDGRVGFSETEELLKLGVDTFVSGTKGVFCCENSRKENWDRLEKILRSNEKVQVKSAVGAGDSFSAAFLHKYMSGCDIQSSMEYASRVAGCVVSHLEAVPDYNPKDFE